MNTHTSSQVFSSINSSVRIASSVRLILAMFNIIADIKQNFGRAVIDILKNQYPDQDVNINPGTVGSKLMAIAMSENQNDPVRAEEVVQDYLAYLSVGKTKEVMKTVKEVDESGEIVEKQIPVETGEMWNFRKDFDKWEDALKAIYTNVRRRGISRSISQQRKKKREKSVDDAFGTRGEGGGAPEGGEAKIPTAESSPLGKALDEKAAVKEFVEVLGEYLPELERSLSHDSRCLFELIFEDEVGSFSSDINANMNQASALKEKFPELYEKNSKRWSGFVGDLRKKLLNEIWNFIENYMTPGDFEVLRDQFFSDVSPEYVRRMERKKLEEKGSEQTEKDKRKLSRLKWQQEQGTISPSDKTRLESLTKKLKGQGVNVDAIEASEKGEETSKRKSAASSIIYDIAYRVAFC